MPVELVPFTPTTTVDLDEVAAFTIDGPETMELAIHYREDVKTLIAEIEAGYRPHIAQAHKLHKGLTTELNARLMTPKTALDALNRAIGRYELERRQREEQARRVAEAVARQEALDQQEAEARAAAAQGDHARAREISEAPVEEFMTPVVPVVETKANGVSVVQRYAPEIVDLRALVTFAAQAKGALTALCVQPNEKGLQALVDQMGEGFNIPGVRRVPKAPEVRSTRTR